MPSPISHVGASAAADAGSKDKFGCAYTVRWTPSWRANAPPSVECTRPSSAQRNGMDDVKRSEVRNVKSNGKGARATGIGRASEASSEPPPSVVHLFPPPSPPMPLLAPPPLTPPLAPPPAPAPAPPSPTAPALESTPTAVRFGLASNRFRTDDKPSPTRFADGVGIREIPGEASCRSGSGASVASRFGVRGGKRRVRAPRAVPSAAVATGASVAIFASAPPPSSAKGGTISRLSFATAEAAPRLRGAVRLPSTNKKASPFRVDESSTSAREGFRADGVGECIAAAGTGAGASAVESERSRARFIYINRSLQRAKTRAHGEYSSDGRSHPRPAASRARKTSKSAVAAQALYAGLRRVPNLNS